MSAAAGEFSLLALLSHRSVVASLGCNDRRNCTTELRCGENEKKGTATKVAEKYDGTQSLSHVGKVQCWPPDQKATENSHKVTFSTTVQQYNAKVMIRWKTDKEKNCIFCIDVFLHCIETEVLKLFCLLSLFRLWLRPSKRQKSNIPICRWQRLLSTRKQRLAQISPDWPRWRGECTTPTLQLSPITHPSHRLSSCI